MKKAFVWIVLALLVCLCAAAAAQQQGWVIENGYLCYYQNGTKLTGTQTVDGVSVQFTSDGHVAGNGGIVTIGYAKYLIGTDNKLRTGWQTLNGSRYYFNPESGRAASWGYAKIDGQGYCFDDNGKLVVNAWYSSYWGGSEGKILTGYQKIGENWYFFSSQGSSQNGFVEVNGKKHYFLRTVWDRPEGYREIRGWLELNKALYYLDPETGVMQTGTRTIDGTRYTFNEDGRLKLTEKLLLKMYDGSLRGYDTDGSPLNGLMTLNGKTYYLESGRVRTGSVQVGEDFYTFDDNGVMQTGWVQNRNGYTYYYGEDGKMVRGFVTLEGKKYYLNPAPRTGSFSVQNPDTGEYDVYYADENGVIQTGFIDVDGHTYYYGEDGKRVGRGLHVIDGDTYLLNPYVITGMWTEYDQAADTWIRRYYGEDGKMVRGLCWVNDQLYYFGEDGTAASGWVLVDGSYYYFGPYGGQAYTGLRMIDGKEYFFTPDGVMRTGWADTGDRGWCFFGADGSMVDFTGWTEVTVPAEVTKLSARIFGGVGRNFVIRCEPGSYAERYALQYGFQYDNGVKRVEGWTIGNVTEKVNWVVENYVQPGMSDIEKIRVLHNWLIYNAHYDLTYSSYDAGGVLVRGAGVCNSYALAFQMLLNRAGIPNRFISGTADNGSGKGPEGHAWNMVQADGKWYQVDTTWDDPIMSWTEEGATVSGLERYMYFMVSDAFLSKNHSWSASVQAVDDMQWMGDPGWLSTEQGWRYYDDRGFLVTEPARVDGILYGFTETGLLMQPGWNSTNGAWVYAGSGGELLEDTWLNDGGAWYRLDAGGRMAVGWRSIGGDSYYFLPNGVMATGWVEDGGNWYYLEGSGVMKTGWMKSGDAWFLLLPDGRMATGWQESGGEYYYFQPNGAMATGWVKDGESWYYLEGSGAMATGWKKFGSSWYLFKASGEMATGWTQSGGRWYWFADSGAMKTGWFEDKQAEARQSADARHAVWYWFDDSGAMATGWKEIEGQWELFDESGVWQYTWTGE